MRKFRSLFVFIIVFILLVSCSGMDQNMIADVEDCVSVDTTLKLPSALDKGKTQIPENPLIPWYDGIEADFASRIPEFEGTLEIVLYNACVYINENTNEDGSIYYTMWLEFNVDFQNISSHPIVYHEPQIFSLLNGHDGMLQITMESKSGNVLKSHFFYPISYLKTINFNSIHNYYELQPGEVFTYHFEEVIFPTGSYYTGSLISSPDPGNYFLSVTYAQDLPGFTLHVSDSVSWYILERINFESSEDLIKEYGETTLIVDMNAWVGEITSNQVTITMPEFPPNPADPSE